MDATVLDAGYDAGLADRMSDAIGDAGLDDVVDAADAGVADSVADVADAGSVLTTLASGQNSPWDIAVDTNNAYWTNQSSGTVMKCAVAGCGGNPTPMASGQGSPTGIAVDGTSLYWTNSGAGTVMKLTPK